jgi:hypothetical protein
MGINIEGGLAVQEALRVDHALMHACGYDQSKSLKGICGANGLHGVDKQIVSASGIERLRAKFVEKCDNVLR